MVEFEVQNQIICKPRKTGISLGFCCLGDGETPACMGKPLSFIFVSLHLVFRGCSLSISMLPLITVGIILVIGLTWWCGGTEPASQCRRYGFHPWIGKIPWKRKWQPTPAFLPGESHGQRNLVGYSPWHCKKSEMTDPPRPTHTHHISPPISSRLRGTRTLPDGENSPGIRFAHTVFEHEEASVDPGAVRPGTVTYQPLAEKAAYGWLEGQMDSTWGRPAAASCFIVARSRRRALGP